MSENPCTPIEIDPVAIDRFIRLMRKQPVSGDVSDSTIRIMGSNNNIRATLGPNAEQMTPVRKSV